MSSTTIYYVIYETVNLLNHKTYRGKHITTDLSDGYLGSGTHLHNAINKYGADQFRREILFMAFTADDLSWVEQNEFVTLDWINSLGKSCYNKKVGGQGGWHVVENGEVKHVMQTSAAKANKEATCLEKFGTVHQFLSPEFHSKLKSIYQEKLGADSPLASAAVQKKIKDTVMDRYGVSNVSFIPEVVDKIKAGQARFFANGGKSSVISKTSYYDPADKSKFEYFVVGEEPAGWVKGNPALLGIVEYHNAEGKRRRFRSGDVIPEGWMLGRK